MGEHGTTTDYIHDHLQCIIDEDLRLITIPKNGNVLGVIGDKNVNHVNFKMPRYYNGFDMNEFKIAVDYKLPNGSTSYYDVDDKIIEDDNLLFTWLVDSDVTSIVGSVSFSVNLYKYVDGVVVQSFATTIAKGSILESINAEILDPDEKYLADYVCSFQEAVSYIMN